MTSIIFTCEHPHLAKALQTLLAYYHLDEIGQVQNSAHTHDTSTSTTLTPPIRAGVILDSLAAEKQRQISAQTIIIGPYRLRPKLNVLERPTNPQTRIKLTDIETQILCMLAEAPGSVSRESLLQTVWGYRPDLDTHTVETHIYRLRQKIEPDPANPSLLCTVKGGYTLGQAD